MPDNSHVNQVDFISKPAMGSNMNNREIRTPLLEDCHASETLSITGSDVNQSNPVAALAGKYAQEPLWSEFLKSIEEYDQEVNLREGKAE